MFKRVCCALFLGFLTDPATAICQQPTSLAETVTEAMPSVLSAAGLCREVNALDRLYPRAVGDPTSAYRWVRLADDGNGHWPEAPDEHDELLRLCRGGEAAPSLLGENAPERVLSWRRWVLATQNLHEWVEIQCGRGGECSEWAQHIGRPAEARSASTPTQRLRRGPLWEPLPSKEASCTESRHQGWKSDLALAFSSDERSTLLVDLVSESRPSSGAGRYSCSSTIPLTRAQLLPDPDEHSVETRYGTPERGVLPGATELFGVLVRGLARVVERRAREEMQAYLSELVIERICPATDRDQENAEPQNSTESTDEVQGGEVSDGEPAEHRNTERDENSETETNTESGQVGQLTARLHRYFNHTCTTLAAWSNDSSAPPLRWGIVREAFENDLRQLPLSAAQDVAAARGLARSQRRFLHVALRVVGILQEDIDPQRVAREVVEAILELRDVAPRVELLARFILVLIDEVAVDDLTPLALEGMTRTVLNAPLNAMVLRARSLSQEVVANVEALRNSGDVRAWCVGGQEDEDTPSILQRIRGQLGYFESRYSHEFEHALSASCSSVLAERQLLHYEETIRPRWRRQQWSVLNVSCSDTGAVNRQQLLADARERRLIRRRQQLPEWLLVAAGHRCVAQVSAASAETALHAFKEGFASYHDARPFSLSQLQEHADDSFCRTRDVSDLSAPLRAAYSRLQIGGDEISAAALEQVARTACARESVTVDRLGERLFTLRTLVREMRGSVAQIRRSDEVAPNEQLDQDARREAVRGLLRHLLKVLEVGLTLVPGEASDVELPSQLFLLVDSTVDGDYGAILSATASLLAQYGEETSMSPRLVSALAFAASVLDAENEEQVEEALEAFALRPGGWRGKIGARDGWHVHRLATLNAYVGFFGAYELFLDGVENNDETFGFGVHASVGFDFNIFAGPHGHLGFYVPLLDLSSLVSAPIGGDSETEAKTTELGTNFDVRSVFAPGLYFRVGLGRSPFTLAAGVSYVPRAREFVVDDDDAMTTEKFERDIVRFGVFLAVDVSLFRLSSNR